MSFATTSFLVQLLNYLVIQLYAYIGTRHIFQIIDRRRERRMKRMNREFSHIEIFGELLFSFLIAGMIYLGVSNVFPTLTIISTPIWLVDLALLIVGYFLASTWRLLKNPFN